MLSVIQSNVPVSLFEIASLTPGITVFGLSFMTLFSATLLARDRESSFLQRLYTTPMKAKDFILGYMLPMIPIAMVQGLICYAVAMVLGLQPTVHIVYAVLMIAPLSVLYISLGLLCGSLFNVKQVGGICGALLTNLSAWLSGVWFDLDLMGESFRNFASFLPFVHAVELERAMLSGIFEGTLTHLLVVLVYAVAITGGAILIFLYKMKDQ
jgi:ABC-2 type transport system permease protein